MANKNDLLFDKPTLVNGGQTNEAVVVTSPDKQHVNAPTVEDIQRIAKGIAEKEAEAASATEWEKELKSNLYFDKTNDDIVVKKTLVDANGDAIIPNAYTKTESDARYSVKESGGMKMIVATIPSSLLVASADRDATEDEKQWIAENYNALFFRKDSLVLQNVQNENEPQYISFKASNVGERDSNGDIVQMYQTCIFLNLNTEKVNIKIVDIDNT